MKLTTRYRIEDGVRPWYFSDYTDADAARYAQRAADKRARERGAPVVLDVFRVTHSGDMRVCRVEGKP